MHHYQPKTYSLLRYCTDSGLWVRKTLASQVSSVSVEAMNAICEADGILAYIGTKYGCGIVKSTSKDLREADLTRCWTSLPEATILATLGLSRSSSTARARKLELYGSPRTLMLCNLIERCRDGTLTWRDLYSLSDAAYAKGMRVWKTFPFNGIHHYAQEQASKDECWRLLSDFAVWFYNHWRDRECDWHRDEIVYLLLDLIWDHPNNDDPVE